MAKSFEKSDEFDENLFDGNGDLLPVQHDVQHRILGWKVRRM